MHKNTGAKLVDFDEIHRINKLFIDTRCKECYDSYMK